jgi:hypothetical protein
LVQTRRESRIDWVTETASQKEGDKLGKASTSSRRRHHKRGEIKKHSNEEKNERERLSFGNFLDGFLKLEILGKLNVFPFEHLSRSVLLPMLNFDISSKIGLQSYKSYTLQHRTLKCLMSYS